MWFDAFKALTKLLRGLFMFEGGNANHNELRKAKN